MTTAKEAFRETFATLTRIHENAKWVACPICREDWTKLTEVFFFKKDVLNNWRRCEVYCCPPCSRSVRSVGWFNDKFQMDIQGDVKLLDAFRNMKFPDDHDPVYAFYLQLPNARIIPRGSGVEVHQEGVPKEFFPNIACAMSFLAHGKKETLDSTDWQ